MDWKLELVAVPVTDVDRAKAFYVDQVGFHADHDHRGQRAAALRAADAAGLGVLDRPGHRDLDDGAGFGAGSADRRRRRRRRPRRARRPGRGGQRGPGLRLGPVRVLLRSRRQRLGPAGAPRPLSAARPAGWDDTGSPGISNPATPGRAPSGATSLGLNWARSHRPAQRRRPHPATAAAARTRRSGRSWRAAACDRPRRRGSARGRSGRASAWPGGTSGRCPRRRRRPTSGTGTAGPWGPAPPGPLKSRAPSSSVSTRTSRCHCGRRRVRPRTSSAGSRRTWTPTWTLADGASSAQKLRPGRLWPLMTISTPPSSRARGRRGHGGRRRGSVPPA